ncbi:hypothetical protein Fmac_007686 [Flemingia macrophylla]|uniref:Uncharacterized protein n=1 Tax=Flemingia macrophylla TaxID=520843 RepID=A0ABD1MV90_9FABA
MELVFKRGSGPGPGPWVTDCREESASVGDEVAVGIDGVAIGVLKLAVRGESERLLLVVVNWE